MCVHYTKQTRDREEETTETKTECGTRQVKLIFFIFAYSFLCSPALRKTLSSYIYTILSNVPCYVMAP